MLRRQTDDFIELDSLRELISRPPRDPAQDEEFYSGDDEIEVLEDRRKM